MNFNQLNMGMFNAVQYSPELKDDSWVSQLDAAADICRAPSRWVVAELGEGLFERGGKTYTVTHFEDTDNDAIQIQTETLHVREEPLPVVTGMQKVMRIVLGLLLSIPGQILAMPLTAVTYCCSEEIRLKHTMTVRTLTDEERERLLELIEKRQELAKERQGCADPISCFVCTICSLLCYIVCCKDERA